MEKKPAKKAKATSGYDSKRQQNVLLEKMYSEIKAISEGHSFISGKIEELDKTLRRVDANSFRTEMDLQAIKSKTGTVDIKIDRVEKELETVKMAVMDNSREIKGLKSGQEEIKQKLDTVTTDHERRLQKLEAAP